MRLLAQVAGVALALTIGGCVYSTADPHYRDHPELVNIRLATGRRDRHAEPPPNLGMVSGRAVSWNSCDEAVTHALSDMLADARALGGTGVTDVRFRGRYTWVAFPACRRIPFTLWMRCTTEAQGLAVTMPPAASAPPQ
jgi:hypothetical protein